MAKVRLHCQREFGGTSVVIALAARVEGKYHAGGAATSPKGWLLDSGFYSPDHCFTDDRMGCIIATEIRTLRRTLGLVALGTKITVVTATHGTAQLLNNWLNGDLALPPWYIQPENDHQSENDQRRRKPALLRTQTRLLLYAKWVRVQYISPPHPLTPLVALASELSKVSLQTTQRHYTPPQGTAYAEGLFTRN